MSHKRLVRFGVDLAACGQIPTRPNEADCLVADVQMPGMNGVELHRHLVDTGNAIPTILITAYPDEVVRNRALKDGVVCYLSKPADDDHLERCLRSALQPGTPN